MDSKESTISYEKINPTQKIKEINVLKILFAIMLSSYNNTNYINNSIIFLLLYIKS